MSGNAFFSITILNLLPQTYRDLLKELLDAVAKVTNELNAVFGKTSSLSNDSGLYNSLVCCVL